MNIGRFEKFKNDVIVVDGIWGSGKSLITPIISSIQGVEKQRIDYIYEYLCTLNWLKKIDPKCCEELISYYVDINHYDNTIGREVNTKIGDDTSIFNNPNSLLYLKRILFNKGVEINQINALLLMTHTVFAFSDPLFNALGDRLKFIEIVRHPLYMVRHWFNAFERFNLPTEFELCLDIKDGSKVPWFAKGWAKEFQSVNNVEKSLLSIINLYNRIDREIVKNQKNFLLLSFESLLTSPHSNINELCLFLDRKKPKNIEKVLKKQKIPRKTISAGKGHSKYGWNGDSGQTEKEVYDSSWNFIEQNCSSEYCKKFAVLIDWYDKKFPSVLSKLSYLN
jgi:hypothetical protein